MLATGFDILIRDPAVVRLRDRAIAEMRRRPEPTPEQMTRRRYGAATLYEDALDVADRDPETASMILTRAVDAMLEYRFWEARRPQPRLKDLLDATREVDPELAEAARAFFDETAFVRRRELAERIADLTIEAHGFFEWDSAREAVERPSDEHGNGA